jgi:hypothetical protein
MTTTFDAATTKTVRVNGTDLVYREIGWGMAAAFADTSAGVAHTLMKEVHIMRSIIIAATATATLFSSPAFAQQPNQGAASIPDFSGKWSHPYVWGFEPPPSGPGPVVNKARLKQIFALPPAKAPLVGDPRWLIGDYSNPILKPEAAEVVKKHGEISLSGVNYPTPANQCWPGGVPFIFWTPGMVMLQQPDKITILCRANEFRQVRMNKPHPAHVTPSWYGDSVGHFEGDTLVIDTVGVKIGPFAMVDMFGTPRTEALHVVERYRPIDYAAAKEAWERNENFHVPDAPEVDPAYKGKGLQLQFMVEDEGVFTMPWSATVTYRRGLDEADEFVCAENPHGFYAGKDPAVPRADKADF